MRKDKITKIIHAFLFRLCYNDSGSKGKTLAPTEKEYPYEQYLIFSDTKGNVRISLR